MSFRLSVEDGRYARTLEVRSPDVTVGTARGCGLRLESEGVGRHHARLRQCGRRVVVEDLGAREGCVVQGRRVHRAALGAGDSVTIGGASLKVLDVEAAKASAGESGARIVGPSRRARRRRAVPLVVSVAAHVIAIAALWGTVFLGGGRPPETAHFAIAAPVDLVEIPDEIEIERDPEPVLPERTPEDPEEVLAPEEEVPERPLVLDDPRFRPLEPVDEVPEADASTTLGIGGLPAHVAAKSFGKGEAGAANRAAAGVLDDDPSAAAALGRIRGRCTPETVWILRGDYDQAEKVFDELGAGYALVSREEMETRDVPDEVRLVVYNCTGQSFSPDTQARLAAWVRRGGWLLSTDWGVERLLEKGMPDTLAPLRVRQRPVLTAEETVRVRPTRARGLSEGLPTDDVVSRWWLEDSSVPFTIAAGLDAEILVRSEDLDRRLGREAAGVAVTFPFGRGRVLHMLGHVFQQEGNLRGALIAQRLVVNFAAAAFDD